MVGLQTLDLAIGVRVPASQPNRIKHLRAAQKVGRPFCVLCAMSREQLEALGYTFVESDLAPIVREWSVGDAVLCATLSAFDYSDHDAWKKT